jgi:NADH-quinone oxidoreductase subunit J
MHHTRKIIHSLLVLMLIFLITAFFWISLNAEFLAFSLVLLYIGAITIIFLFAIMVLNLQSHNSTTTLWVDLKSYLVAASFLIIMLYIIKDYNFPVTTSITGNNLDLLSQTLLNNYILLFCLAGIGLLSAVIIVVCLINKDHKGN